MQEKLEAFFFGKVERWFLLLTVLLCLVAGLGFGWIVHHNLALDSTDRTWTGQLALEVAQLPDHAQSLLKTGLEFDEDGFLVQRNLQIIDYPGQRGLVRVDPDFRDDGLLLISAYSDEHAISTVSLFDLASGQTLWEWVPNHQQIVAQTPSLKRRAKDPASFSQTTDAKRNFQSYHPYLLENGNVLIHSDRGVLVMINPEGDVVWTLEGVYHHSIERMADGNFVICKIMKSSPYAFQDDGYAIVSPDGELLEERSIAGILERNGYAGLIYGTQEWSPGLYEPLHVNDIEPIHTSDDHVQAGDLVFSLRHISTVFQYRPSEDKIVWLQTGPWLNQHDVDYQGNGVFSIFDNAAVRSRRHLIDESMSEQYHQGRPVSSVVFFQPATAQFERPHADVFAQEGLFTHTQGLHRVLPNGDLYVEMQNQNELLRVGPQGLRWRYTRPLQKDGQIGMPHWSRYLHRDEVDLSWLPASTSPKAKADDSSPSY